MPRRRGAFASPPKSKSNASAGHSGRLTPEPDGQVASVCSVDTPPHLHHLHRHVDVDACGHLLSSSCPGAIAAGDFLGTPRSESPNRPDNKYTESPEAGSPDAGRRANAHDSRSLALAQALARTRERSQSVCQLFGQRDEGDDDDDDDVGVFGGLDLDACPLSHTPPFPTASDEGIGSVCCSLSELPRELLVLCLGYLRPWDLVAVAITSTHFYDYNTIAKVVEPLLQLYGGAPTGSVGKGVGPLLEGLRYKEVQYLHKLLSAPDPLPPAQGYWLSKSWATNHRRFAEALHAARRRNTTANGKGRRLSVRERRESDAMPPWPDVNADITCQHGNLRPLPKQGQANSSGGGGVFSKRRVVEKRVWRAIRRFYPEATAFKTSTTEECPECSGKDREEKDRLEEEKRLRDAERTSSPALERLFNRRSGTPPAHGPAPLDPGLYHLLPRCWLNQWRAYLRDPRASRPRSPECSLVLCEAHGLPLIPPHVQDFLTGATGGRGLLWNLGSRSGVVCEVITTDEWDALSTLYRTDFCLKFSVDPDDLSVSWSTTPCQRCDPTGYDQSEVTVRNRQRKWAL